MPKRKPKHKVKSPVAVMQVSSQKKPHYEPAPDPNSAFPSWRVALLEMVGPFGWHEIDKDKLSQVREKLANFESMTWNETLVTHKHQNHSVTLDKLCKDALDRLREIKQDDIESLVSLRLTGKERVWGIRQGEVLKVLWWDPEHLVCPSLKTHT